MSNFEERSPSTDNAQKKTALQKLEDFNRIKQNLLYHLASAMNSLKAADKYGAELEATGCPTVHRYFHTIGNVRELRDEVIAMRAPRALINAVSTEAVEAREKAKEIGNDRLRRAMFTSASEGSAGNINSSSETLSSGRRAWDAAAVGHSFPISMAPTTEDNSAGTQSPSEMAGKQVHSAGTEELTPKYHYRSCPSCGILYGRNRIGIGCNNCRNTLPPF